MQKNLKRNALIFAITAVLFFVLTLFSNLVLGAYDVTSVRLSAEFNPILGIAFGWPAILACALANCFSDLISGYGITIALLGILSQIAYGAFPYYLWRRFVGGSSHFTRLDGPKKTVCFVLLMAVDCVLMGLSVGFFQLLFSGDGFWSAAYFAFLNDFDSCLIFGLPLMAGIDFVYSKYVYHGKRNLSFNEKIILFTSLIQLLAFLVVVCVTVVSNPGKAFTTLWVQIFLIAGNIANILLVASALVMTYFGYLKQKHAGLRIFEKPNGTIFVDEKKRLEFLSFPGKPLSFRIKSDALGYTYEKMERTVHVSYENAWYTVLTNQKGCPMKCTFCDCPSFGYYGNVSLNDLRYQLDTIMDNVGSTHTKWFQVDFMRMGEPTLNPAILEYLEHHMQQQIREKVDVDVIYPTLSTMLPTEPEQVTAFLQEFCRIKNEVYDGNAALELSLNSTDEAQRRKLFRGMTMSLEEIAALCKTLPLPKGRKYALSFAVAKDTAVDAAVIDRLFDKEKFLIKLTPIHNTFNAIDNGFVTAPGLPAVEERFTALGWDVMLYLDSGDEDADALTNGNLLLPNISDKFSPRPSEKKKIGMIVAIEMDAIFAKYTNWKELAAPCGYKLYLVEKETYDIYILQTGMGEVAAAAGVQHLITQWKVAMIVNFGVVGGLTMDMKRLKVCLVEQVVHYKYDCSEFMDLVPGQVDGHESIFLKTTESFVRNALLMNDALTPVTCCSGDKFISTTEEKQYLHNTFYGDICDMESAGIVLTCERNHVPCLLLKAVSDGLMDGAEGFYAQLQTASIRCLDVADTIMDRIALME